MLSNARGKHSSPGVYMEEIDKTYSTKSIGSTILGVAGETLKGPAFEPITITDWNEFKEYFGDTSTVKFKGTGYPKYELPYIAKSFLQESKHIEVCRVLGLSGYDAGPAWVIYGSKDPKISAVNDRYVIAVLRSKGNYKTGSGDPCNPNQEIDKIDFVVKDVKISNYVSIESSLHGCANTNTSTNCPLSVGKDNYGKFTLVVETSVNNITKKETIGVSLNPGEKNYIVNVLGMDPHVGDYSLFIEELYDLSHIDACDNGLYTQLGIEKFETDSMSNYKEQFRCAFTPWFVSEIKGVGANVEVKKLFRFYTISDGNAANSQIKISIANILPDEGLFDVLIRDFNDTDGSPMILEQYTKCSMVPGSSNYIGLKIGTFNGEYANKSKYVTVEIIENDMTANCVPCGFLGYPVRNLPALQKMDLKYNTTVYDTLKPNRQYFGLSDISGVDLDVLTYKGKNSYTADQLPKNGYTKGFHLDSFLNVRIEEGSYDKLTKEPTDKTADNTLTVKELPLKQNKDYKYLIYQDNYYIWKSNKSCCVECTVDGVSGYQFTTPKETTGSTMGATSIPHISSEDLMVNNIYNDKRYRKFTCYPYGGFDGWDIYRSSRTNTNEYKANKYQGAVNTYDENNQLSNKHAFSSAFDGASLGLTGKVINSDYYAYLAGYKQFDNPNKVKINLFATPGIDYVHNLDLFNEALDIVEEYRQGDCLYIVTTPDTEDNDFITPLMAVSNLEGQEISTSYAATFYPWVKYYDATNKKYINLPATKDVVRNFAYTDNVLHPWFASAGMSRGNVDCVKASYFTKIDDEDALYEGMINPIKSFGNEVKVWGNKTMYKEDTPLNRINVRRLMIKIKDLVLNAATQLVFDQNDNTVDSQFRSIVDPILSNAKQNRGISDYKIKTDTSAEARDRKELPAAIYVKPINCLEYIPITFTIYPESTKFDE